MTPTKEDKTSESPTALIVTSLYDCATAESVKRVHIIAIIAITFIFIFCIFNAFIVIEAHKILYLS